MTRAILLIHRYLGVLTGLLMTVWCLSGIVMIYVDFPSISRADRLKGAEPLNLSQCCDLGAVDIADDETIGRLRLSMAGGHPVLLAASDQTGPRTIDLVTGQRVGEASAARARDTARRFAHRLGFKGEPDDPVRVESDQWTVNTGGAPFWRVDFKDRGARIYVSQASGDIAQMTTRAQRGWNWVGAVPHWLYPTILRQNGALWTQVVIWTSVLGCFLTATGLWVGIARFRPRATAKGETRWSPYVGLNYWHHITGLVFGLLTLTFVFSGLVSMNPWGLWAGGGEPMSYLLEGEPVTWSEARPVIAAARRLDLPPSTVELVGAPLGGKLYLAARTPYRTKRFDERGEILAPDVLQLTRLLSTPDSPGLASLVELRREDAYYFGHRQPVTLPVWRAVMRDGERTRLYIDPVTGQLIGQIGADARAFRWGHEALHRLDFNAGLRRRPLWDAMILLAMAGVTAVCGIGAWMGLRRIRMDWDWLRRR